jgi:cytochrome bd ubiquinol oxidase subunit I
MIDPLVLDLSRLQFALTAMYHFLFVPLTLGLSVLVAMMETVYVMTGKQVWRDMTKFWGLLFGINFAIGVATGITMEFQFGMNWSYYSHYVGDIFGAPLAIEGLMAFFLEATLVGMMFFGWERLSKLQHLIVTWLTAIGTNLSALWILIANGWMQNPVGSSFNPETMRMEVTDFAAVLFNPVAQAKFVHTVSAGYVTGAIFVMAISAYYVLRGRNLAFARRSMAVAAAFGLLSSLSVVVLGDESGYTTSLNQQMKMAAMEAMWETEDAPAGLTLFGIPDRDAQETHFEVKLPYVLGLIGTRSFTEEMPGIKQLVQIAEQRARDGIKAYEAVQKLRESPHDIQAAAIFRRHQEDLGYGLLVKQYREDIENATDEDIRKAALSTVPDVRTLFYAFRLMVGLGLFFIAFFAYAFVMAAKRKLLENKTFLKVAFYSLPLPWIAIQLGWLVAEYGRQPWTVDGVLPTALSVSSLGIVDIVLTIIGFTVFYGVLLVIEVWLMRKYVIMGPENALHHGSDESHAAASPMLGGGLAGAVPGTAAKPGPAERVAQSPNVEG